MLKQYTRILAVIVLLNLERNKLSTILTTENHVFILMGAWFLRAPRHTARQRTISFEKLNLLVSCSVKCEKR